jgi:hypothetical protein
VRERERYKDKENKEKIRKNMIVDLCIICLFGIIAFQCLSFFSRYKEEKKRKLCSLSTAMQTYNRTNIQGKKKSSDSGQLGAKCYYLLGPIINLLYGNHIFIESAITLHANRACVCMCGFV